MEDNKAERSQTLGEMERGKVFQSLKISGNKMTELRKFDI